VGRAPGLGGGFGGPTSGTRSGGLELGGPRSEGGSGRGRRGDSSSGGTGGPRGEGGGRRLRGDSAGGRSSCSSAVALRKRFRCGLLFAWTRRLLCG